MVDKKHPHPLRPKAEWHSRGYLPHWEVGEEPQSITFRLADSLPAEVRERLKAAKQEAKPDPTEQRKRFEELLDSGHGEALLRQPEVGRVVEDSLLHFDGQRYRLHAWSVMPNHVHALATPINGHALSAIVHAWKSFTALQINRLLGRQGSLWFPEYFDRKIRNERHFEAARYYIEQNSVEARLCAKAEEWPFSSAKRNLERGLPVRS
ncbi:transposase [Labrys okinawensis]|uniref:transposase n=1 Tax=Labrys okinawensis TaxID=346911 RepID=UPI0039BC8BC5